MFSWCAFQLKNSVCHRLARSTYKPDFLFSNFGCGVLHNQKCYVMFSCIESLCTYTGYQRFFSRAAGIFVSRVRREFSVLAEGRHIFGLRPKPRAAKPRENSRVTMKTWQKPETALEKSLAPRVLCTKTWHNIFGECFLTKTEFGIRFQ